MRVIRRNIELSDAYMPVSLPPMQSHVLTSLQKLQARGLRGARLRTT